MSDKARIDEITGYIIDTVIDDMLGRIRRGEATSEPKKLDSYEFKMFGGFFGSLTKEGKYITEAISNALNKFDIYPKFKKQSEKEFLVDYVISDFAFNRIKALVGNINRDLDDIIGKIEQRKIDVIDYQENLFGVKIYCKFNFEMPNERTQLTAVTISNKEKRDNIVISNVIGNIVPSQIGRLKDYITRFNNDYAQGGVRFELRLVGDVIKLYTYSNYAADGDVVVEMLAASEKLSAVICSEEARELFEYTVEVDEDYQWDE